MRYKLGPLELYSAQSTRLLDFLSDVLELEVDVSQSKVIICGQEFIIKESSPDRTYQKTVDFHLEIDSRNLIDEIKQKLNFFLYRKNPEAQIEKLVSEDATFGCNLLILSDIDGRHWHIVHRFDPYKLSF